MWIVYACAAALFAGITSILAKCGISKTDSTVATAIRTIVVLLFSWLMVFIVGSQSSITTINTKTLIFLILSGIATGASWLCYFKALQLGDINKVVPIDKLSTVLTLLLAFIFLGEQITLISSLGIIAIGLGTYFMIEKKKLAHEKKVIDNKWFIYASLSAIFASLTSILGKIGINGVESNLGTAIRTIVVLLMAWFIVFTKKKQHTIKDISKKELLFIILSGIATGASWLCYYKALQGGLTTVVVPIDKLSILVSIGFSYFVFKEKLPKKSFLGLALIVIGTFLMIII